ncbi:asparagine synthase-related protein [Caulobacter segnis]
MSRALNGGADAAPAVLRDPSGAVNCLCRVVDGLVLAASDLATLLDASGPAPVDWDYVAINAANLTAAPQATALAGVMELPPGTIARPGAPLDFAPIWSPWTYARQAAPVADTELPALIETTVKDCVSAWAQTFSHVSLGVSGGLDSSVVAACLAAGPIAVSSYTFATHDADGDERRHARLLTQALGLSLHECFYRLEDINIDVSLAAHLPRPLSNYVAQSLTRETARLREEQGVDAHFSGSGGDNIFCLLHSAAPLVDQVRAGTTPAALWRSVRDLSRLTTASALEIVRLALIHGRDKRQFRPAAPANPFLRLSGNPHLAHRFDHPWLQAPDDIPPGKVRHVALLALAELGAGSDPARDLPPVILPLLAQPLVEALPGDSGLEVVRRWR